MNEQDVFQAALETDSLRRGDFLDEACGDDLRLRQRVEELLKLHDQAGDFFEKPAAEIVATSHSPKISDTPGTKVGPYRLIETIGEGGMGMVYMAAQKEPVRRTVALKILKQGMDTKEVITRFQAERQALALMNHPNVAKVLDAGATESGRPYFVMELVRGVPINEFCDQRKLGPRQRLELFATVCQAVQHAHLKGIIHRDLKPSNVLVEVHDVTAVPKVIDFGVAKAVNQQLTEHSVYTGFAQMVGTPLYMSPEQAELSGLDIDTRTDIYSLGVLLYELLTGTTPFASETFKQVGYDEMRRIIREDEPQRPSDRISTLAAEALSTISAQRASDPRRLHHALRGELDWIVMKAMEKDRSRRYDTATAFAADINRYLNNQPVHACSPSVAYRFRKFVRRNKTVIGTATTAFLFAAIVMGAAQIMIRIRHPSGQVTDITAPRGNAVTVDGKSVTVTPGPATFQLREFFETTSRVADVSADGSTLCYLHPKNGALVFRDLASGAEQQLPTEEGYLRIHRLALSRDGQRAAYSWADIDDPPSYPSRLRVVDRDGGPYRSLRQYGDINAADWSPDGKSILGLRGRDGRFEIVVVPADPGDVVDPSDVRVLTSLDSWWIPGLNIGGNWRQQCFSPDGDYVVYDARADKDASQRDIFLLHTDREHQTPVRLELNPADEFVLGWAPDGRILFCSNRARSWDARAIVVSDGQAEGDSKLVRHNVGQIDPMGFTDDGSYYYHQQSDKTSVFIATLDNDRHRIVAPTALLAQHQYEVGAFAPDWSPDGRSLAYSLSTPESDDFTILIRDERTRQEVEIRPKIGVIQSLQWSPDSTSLLARSNRKSFLIHVTGQEVTPVVSPMLQADWSHDGQAIVYATPDHGDKIMMRWLQSSREEELHRVEPPHGLYALALSPGGKELAFSTWEKSANASALYIMPMDRSAPPRKRLQLPRGQWIYRRSLEWTPDGNEILFVKSMVAEAEIQSHTFWRIAAQGDGHGSSLGLGSKDLSHERVFSVWGLSVHPEGRRVAFGAIRYSAGIWVMENLLGLADSAVTIRVEQ